MPILIYDTFQKHRKSAFKLQPELYPLFIFIRREPRRPFFPRALRVPLPFLRMDLPPPAAGAGAAGFEPNNPPNRPPTLFFTLLNIPLELAPLAGVVAGGADILYYPYKILPKPLKLNDLDARTHAHL